jgi:transcriptional regulator with XRE-family HTH domain
MTLEVLAGLCGVSTAYLSMIENGKRGLDPRYSMVLTLANALRVTPADLAPGMSADSSAGSDTVGKPPAAPLVRRDLNAPSASAGTGPMRISVRGS